jgi:hypothetical protein
MTEAVREMVDRMKKESGSVDIKDVDGPMLNVPSCNITTEPKALTQLMNDKNSTAISFMASSAHSPATIIILNGNVQDHLATVRDIHERLAYAKKDMVHAENVVKGRNTFLYVVLAMLAVSVIYSIGLNIKNGLLVELAELRKQHISVINKEIELKNVLEIVLKDQIETLRATKHKQTDNF